MGLEIYRKKNMEEVDGEAMDREGWVGVAGVS